MTIKRLWTDYGNLLKAKFEPRESILQPGYKEEVTIFRYYANDDYEIAAARIQVLTHDKLLLTPVRYNALYVDPTAHVIEPGEPLLLEGDQINQALSPIYPLTDLENKKHKPIGIKWEETLPIQARR